LTAQKSEGLYAPPQLLRSPLQIAPGLLHPYDWQVKIELINGGILEENDPYPYSSDLTNITSITNTNEKTVYGG